MGCFLTCFGDRKRGRRNKKSLPTNRVHQNYQPLQTTPSPHKPIIKEVVADVDVPEPREKQEQVSVGSCRKKVTFDLNVKTYDPVEVDDNDVETFEDEEVKEERKCTVSQDSNYRYQYCESSEDEGIGDDDDDDDDDDDEEYDDSDFDDEDDEDKIVLPEEESYDSFFSLPMDKEKEKQQQDCQEVDSPLPNTYVSAKGSARDRSQYVHSVLNPVENLSQWKEVKVRALPLKNPNKGNTNQNKENRVSELEAVLTGFSPDPAFKANKNPKHGDSKPTSEISVEASLST